MSSTAKAKTFVRRAHDLEETDPGFRDELRSLAVSGLRLTASLTTAGALFMLAVHLGQEEPLAPLLLIHGVLAGAGVTAATATLLAAGKRRARGVGCALGGFLGSVLIFWPIARAEGFHGPDHHIPGNLALVLLVGIAALPLKPSQSLAVGSYFVVCHRALLWMAAGQGYAFAPAHLAETLLVALLSWAATLTVYRQRERSYVGRRRAETAVDQLRESQARLVLSETAASQGRMAASLSHELNTPLAALSSVNDTLFSILKSGPSPSRTRDELLSLEGVSRAASRRLRDVLAGMRRVTNLDRAPLREVDVNELVRDALASSRAAFPAGLEVELELSDVLSVRCQPQKLGVALESLLRRAGSSAPKGTAIRIRTAHSKEQVSIEVHSFATNLPDEAEFASNGKRVTGWNWDLVIARHCICEHRGTLDVVSSADDGTTWYIHLPLDHGVAAA